MAAVHYLFLITACCITGLFYMANRRAFLLSEIFLCVFVTMTALLLWGKRKPFFLLFFLFAMGFLLRAFYIIYTPTWIRQHDVIGFGAGFGQAGFFSHHSIIYLQQYGWKLMSLWAFPTIMPVKMFRFLRFFTVWSPYYLPTRFSASFVLREQRL